MNNLFSKNEKDKGKLVRKEIEKEKSPLRKKHKLNGISFRRPFVFGLSNMIARMPQPYTEAAAFLTTTFRINVLKIFTKDSLSNVI